MAYVAIPTRTTTDANAAADINQLMANFATIVTGTLGASKFVITGASGNTAIAGTLDVTGISSFAAGAAATPSISRTGDLNTGIWFPAADTVAISTGGTERIRTDSSGNVGIGTSTIDTKLHVFGGSAGTVSALSGSLITSESSGNNYLQFLSPNTAFQAILFGDVDNNVIGQIVYSHGTNYLGFHVNVSERMRIDSSGNVGIGTATFGTSAAGALAIKNGTAPTANVADVTQIFSKDASTGGATLGLFTEAAVESIGTFTASHKLKIWINGTEYWIQLDAV